VTSDETRRHSDRFRRVSNRYPRRVAEAYGGDLRRAAGDTDEQVAATVAEWERANGLEVADWPAIGRAEGRPWNASSTATDWRP
jgi:hypothetical protein